MKSAMKKYFLFLVVAFLFFRLDAQSIDFKKNYSLAQRLYENGIIEKVIAKPEKTDRDLKMALLLAEYYKCSNDEIPDSEMRIVLSIYHNDFSWKEKDLSVVEAEYFKMINDIDHMLHTKDFSYLEKLIIIP